MLVWNIAFLTDLRDSGGDVGRAWAVADEAWQRYRERVFGGKRPTGMAKPAPKVLKRKAKK